MDLTKLRASLDQVTLEFFDVLESLYQSQTKLESLMRDGFLSMSRARYSMGGTRNVGALQFAKNEMEMEALSVIDVSAEEESSNKKDNEDSWTDVEFKLFEKQAGRSEKIDAKTSEKIDHVRQRKGKRISGKDEGEDTVETIGMQKLGSEQDEILKSKENSSLRDPLKLFGVLVSPHLRQCQGSFKQAVIVSVEIANLKHKLQGLQHNFEQLLSQKKAILAS